MALELIGAGLGRTGTLSLKAALERIGYGPCYHMIEVLKEPERARHWLEQTEQGSHDWEAIFHGYRATVDWPAAAFWRELAERHPDAKVLLSRRDADRWYDSVMNTIYAVMAQRPPDGAPESAREFQAMVRGLILERTFAGRIEDRAHAKRVFEAHNQAVIDAVRGLMTSDLSEVSLLHLLYLAHSHGSLETLFSIENGAQENMVNGGAGSIAQRVAEGLAGSIRLRAPARAITQRDDHVLVGGDELTVTARRVVVSVPPALALGIAFGPPLPEDRKALCRNAIGGWETKTIVVYDEPFWRADGYSGQTAEPGSAAEVTLDASPSSGRPGVIAAFTFGPVSRRLDSLDAGARRKAVLDALAARLGSRAASPADFVETSWWTEEWSRGCSMAHFTPGTLTGYGHLLREPFGRVHWAGTETATISHGAIDGAVRSGERAAAEILDRA
jgi:monoamine oxidase